MWVAKTNSFLAAIITSDIQRPSKNNSREEQRIRERIQVL